MVLPGSPAVHGQSAVAEQLTDERSLRSSGDLGASSHQKVLTGLTCDSPSASELICYFAGRVDKHDATAHDSYLVAAQMLIHREWNLSRDTLKSFAHSPHKLQPSAVTSGKVWKREREREAQAKPIGSVSARLHALGWPLSYQLCDGPAQLSESERWKRLVHAGSSFEELMKEACSITHPPSLFLGRLLWICSTKAFFCLHLRDILLPKIHQRATNELHPEWRSQARIYFFFLCLKHISSWSVPRRFINPLCSLWHVVSLSVIMSHFNLY